MHSPLKTGPCNGSSVTGPPDRLALDTNSYNLANSAGTGTPTFTMSSQGKFVQRLCRVEEENETLRAELEDLKKWKVAVEAWLIDSFGMGIGSTDVKVSNAKEDDTNSVCSNESHDTNKTPEDEPVSVFQGNVSHGICIIKTEEEIEAENKDPGDQISPTKFTRLSNPAPPVAEEEDMDIIDITISDDDEFPEPSKIGNGLGPDQGELSNVGITINEEPLDSDPIPSNVEVIDIDNIGPLNSEPVPDSVDDINDIQVLNSEAPPSTIDVINNNNNRPLTPEPIINRTNSKPKSAHTFGRSTRNQSNLELEAAVASITEEAELECTPSGSTQEDKTPCDVCKDHKPEDKNSMIYCETCNVCVHQACYGIKHIPEGDWYCQPCTAKIPVPEQKCRFCTTTGGAMLRVNSPKNNTWAHVACVWWIPGVHILNPSRVDVVVGLPNIEKARYRLQCSICKRGKGNTCCIQCRYKRCMTAFHVTCAYKAGLRMEMLDDDNAPDGILLLSFCNAHKNIDVDSLIKQTYTRRKNSTAISPQKKRKIENGAAGNEAKKREA